MKFKTHSPMRLLSMILALLLLIPTFTACGSKSETDAAPSLTVDSNGELHFLYRPTAAEIHAHAEQIAYLYEFTPGESLADINGKSSLLRVKASSKIEFTFPLTDENGADRRCNTYVLTYSDGTIHPASVRLSNPASLAYHTADFPHANSIKGFHAENEELARSLHARHTLISLSASALLESDGSTASYNNITLPINGTLMYFTDEQIKSAVRADMQISLEITVEPSVSTSTAAALIAYLMNRYSTDDIGIVTALILKDGGAVSSIDPAFSQNVSRAAELLRVASVSMVSRIQNGMVYFGTKSTHSMMKDYVIAVVDSARKNATTAIGVALYPDSAIESMIPSEIDESATGESSTNEPKDRPLLLSDLLNTADFLRDKLGRGTELAVLDVDISAEDPDLQAALLAYTYRVSMLANARLMICKNLLGDQTGLFSDLGEMRPAAECFSKMDTSENTVYEALAEELLGAEWSDLKKARVSRNTVTDLSNVASTENFGKKYFDFTKDTFPAFSAVGTASAPSTVYSELWQSNVMATSFTENQFGMASGMRCDLPSVNKLENMHVLSANILSQSPLAESAEITLLLEGTSNDGRTISYHSSVTLPCNTWQSVSFHIRSFTSLLNPSFPCTMSLTMRPITEQEPPEVLPAEGEVNGAEPSVHTLLLQSVSIRGASVDYSSWIMIGIIVGCFAFGFSMILFSLKKKKRK